MGAHAHFRIRRSSPADAEAVLACLAAAFAPFREHYTREAFEDTTLTPRTIRQRMATMTVFVAENNSGDIVGTIACQALSASEGHIRGMAVLPAWHGTGVAADLLRAAEQHLTAHGCSHVTLDTTAPLQRAIHFYERHGYRPTGRISDFFGMPLYEYSKTFQ